MPPMRSLEHGAVDTAADRFISFASGPRPRHESHPAESHVPVPVGRPPRSGESSSPHASGFDAHLINASKVQRPPLRDQTLARPRLLDWLGSKVHHRVVFIVAEAGYGKTTLLADFSGRTRLRTLWYRLDPADREWMVFLRHLVASVREHDPSFGEATAAALRNRDAAELNRPQATETFLADLASLRGEAAAFVFDDFHVVDDAEGVRHLVSELVRRAPERISFVFSSRRAPSVKIARLRAQGEVAELSTDDLRFSGAETEQLFRETYGQPLDHDLLDDVSRRTEGWAASLQLVQAAIRDRSTIEIRRFVRSMTGAEGDLYDYLAEEVVGDLPADLQDFLMKVSLLESVEPALASAAAATDSDQTTAHFAASERLGVLGRRGRGADATRGFHPLVRDFLRARLAREAGDDAIRATHLRIARAAEQADWNTSAAHYLAAGHHEDVHRVIRAAIHTIMGSGASEAAARLLDDSEAAASDADFEAIRSRADFNRGRRVIALDRAERAVANHPASDIALLNLLSLRLSAGDVREIDHLVRRIEVQSRDAVVKSISAATDAVVGLSLDGDVATFMSRVLAMAQEYETAGLPHYAGISFHNASYAFRLQGDASAALSHASRAIELLSVNSTLEEITAARLVRIWALGHTSRWSEAEAEGRLAISNLDPVTKPEALLELAAVHLWYGPAREVSSLLEEAASTIATRPDLIDSWRAVALEQVIRDRNFSRAYELRAQIRRNEAHVEPGFKAHFLALEAYLAIAEKAPDAVDKVRTAKHFAERQGASLWAGYCEVLHAVGGSAHSLSSAVVRLCSTDPTYLSILADEIVERLAELDIEALGKVGDEARAKPHRWRTPLRSAIDLGHPARWRAAELLEDIGEHDDIPRLRHLAARARSGASGRDVGRALARRLAPRVIVEDLGRVSIRIGSASMPGAQVRRKVLALLCFLLSRQNFSATRDEVVDALWPELEPSVALNSLNQTVYFLRRVFEPDYAEEVSPGYVVHDSNVLWLDSQLVDALSVQCWRLIRAAIAQPPGLNVEALSQLYTGRFALDFAYEDWAIAYRDSLHAAFLQLVEAAIARDTASGSYTRAIELARRALECDPAADQVELSLLRLYRLSGAHAAAAEQYGHYAAAQRRDLGVEAPPLEML
jgi:DNA-binding SARP family transcriptional activator